MRTAQTIENDSLQPWELVERILHNEGWSLGWALQSDGSGNSIWCVDGSKGEDRIIEHGKTLTEAFGKLYYLIHSE